MKKPKKKPTKKPTKKPIKRSIKKLTTEPKKKFLAIYLGAPYKAATEKWEGLDEKTRKRKEKLGMEKWMKWGEEKEKYIVDQGAPLGKTKRADDAGISDIKNEMTGYTIVTAESLEAAAKLFLKHPHFSIFPGESVEIMECLSIPDMPE